MSNKNKTDNQPAVKKRWYSYKVKVRENGKLKQKYQGFDLAVNEEEIFLKWEAQGIPREYVILREAVWDRGHFRILKKKSKEIPN